MLGGGITKHGFSNVVYPCGICKCRVKASSVLCVQCGKWIRSRCALVKYWECGELLNGKRFPLRLKWVVYKSNV